MNSLDSLLATILTRRLDTLLDALGPPASGARGTPVDAATPAAHAAVGESASASIALTSDTSTSTPDRTDAGQSVPQRQPSATLSVAARTIDTVLQLASGSPGAIRGTTPLWPLPPGDATHAFAPVFAAALKNAVDDSGLFYESHLAQWAAGSRSLEQLRQDPQAGWPPDSFPAPARPAPPASSVSDPQPAASGNTPSSVVGNPLTPAPRTVPALATQTDGTGAASAHALAQAAPATLSATPPPAPLPAPGNVTLLRQQLDMLVIPQFHWVGEAWPGATLDWTVEEQREQLATDQPAAPGTWQTRLRLSLAALGAIDVSVSLAGHQLQLQIQAAEPQTVSLMTDGSGDLRQRLAATGLLAGPVRVGLMTPATAEGQEAGS